MSYDQLIQLYFERSNALQAYWTLYVVIVGGLLAFSSLRKEPATLTTLIVSILFGLFAYENHDAIQNTSVNDSRRSKRSNNPATRVPCARCSSRR